MITSSEHGPPQVAAQAMPLHDAVIRNEAASTDIVQQVGADLRLICLHDRVHASRRPPGCFEAPHRDIVRHDLLAHCSG